MAHNQQNTKMIEEEKGENTSNGCTTLDGSVDLHGRPAIKAKTGGWSAGFLLLVNQGLATLAFFGLAVNLVLFLTRVLQQNNADAANNVSKWTGTVYLFSLVGAFLSDSYWGRYKTCAIFQAIFVLGLVMLSLSSYLFMLSPKGCGDPHTLCKHHSTIEVTMFYIAIYLVALGNGGYQPNIATFGSDQFDGEDPKECTSKTSFFSYFYLSLNLGSLFSNTFLSYIEDKGHWAMGFWLSSASALMGLVLFFVGTPWYRHFTPVGNPLARVGQVVVAASRKSMIQMPLDPKDEHLYEVDLADFDGKNVCRKILHTQGLRFFDKAAIVVDSRDFTQEGQDHTTNDPWRLCTTTQVEEVKCVIRLLPIWLCTILYSVIFTQMASLFVVQGLAMDLNLLGFRIPASSMSAFDIASVAAFIVLYKRVINPMACRLHKGGKGLTELQRMGIGLVLAVATMIASGLVEHYRLRKVAVGGNLSVFWQVPQYTLLGASEVFMYVGQLEFFNGHTPDGLKTFGSALCMTSMSFGNYVSSLIVSAVMAFTKNGKSKGWIPDDLDEGRLDNFYFLLAILASVDFFVYLACARSYREMTLEGRCQSQEQHINDISGV